MDEGTLAAEAAREEEAAAQLADETGRERKPKPYVVLCHETVLLADTTPTGELLGVETDDNENVETFGGWIEAGEVSAKSRRGAWAEVEASMPELKKPGACLQLVPKEHWRALRVVEEPPAPREPQLRVEGL